jgi:hypothetical protein
VAENLKAKPCLETRAFRILAGGERQSQRTIRTMLGHDVRGGGRSVARTRVQTKPSRTRRSRTAPRHAGRRGPPVGPCSPEAPARRLHMSSTASASCSCRIRPFPKRPWRSPAGQHSLLTCVNPSPWAMAMVAASRGEKGQRPKEQMASSACASTRISRCSISCSLAGQRAHTKHTLNVALMCIWLACVSTSFRLHACIYMYARIDAPKQRIYLSYVRAPTLALLPVLKSKLKASPQVVLIFNILLNRDFPYKLYTQIQHMSPYAKKKVKRGKSFAF